MAAPSGLAQAYWHHRASRAAGWEYRGRRPARAIRSAWPVGERTPAPGRQPWCGERHGGVTVNTGTRESPGAGPSPAPGVTMESWIVWLVLAALLALAEVLTTTLAFGLLAVAAAVAAVVGGAGLGVPFQIAAFAVAAGAGLGVVRPIAVRHIRQPPPLKTGTSALVGRSAVVTQEVTALDGRVRIGGEVWSARSYDESSVIPEGSKVDVLAIEGATALVHPRE